MKRVSHLIKITFTMGLLLQVGCSSMPKPPVAQVSLNVQSMINPYIDGKGKPESRPVVIRLFELKSPAAFNSADFFSVFNHYQDTLNTELLNSEEFHLSPGKKLKFERTLHLDTRYIGVVSAFRDLEHAQWRATTAIPREESHPEIYVLLEGNQVLIGAKPQCGFLCRFWSPKPPVGSLYEIIDQQIE